MRNIHSSFVKTPINRSRDSVSVLANYSDYCAMLGTKCFNDSLCL